MLTAIWTARHHYRRHTCHLEDPDSRDAPAQFIRRRWLRGRRVVELSVLLKEADDHGTHGDDSPSVGLRGLHGFTDENRCKTSALTSR